MPWPPVSASRSTFSTARLLEETPRLANPSEIVFRETGCWGVAEGAALAAVVVGGRLHSSGRGAGEDLADGLQIGAIEYSQRRLSDDLPVQAQ